MKKSTKAALLPGLIFPGIGHISLKQNLRGSILILIALTAAAVVVNEAFKRAQLIVDRIVSGEIPVDAAVISGLASDPSGGSGSLIPGLSTFIFGACWLIGVIDSYRVGINLEKL